MHLTRSAVRDDRGLTLVELIVAIAILGIIVVPLGAAAIGFLRHSDGVGRRMAESHDVQIAAAYFARDVQSVGIRDWTAHPYPLQQSIELGVAANAGLYPCGAGTEATLVRLAWDDPDTAPQVTRVAYVVSTVGTERRLRRLLCVGSATPISDIVLAHHVDGTPSVACSTSCTAAPAVPRSVTMTLSVRDPAGGGSPLTVILSGQRRQT
jgi:prepilin-type N-terminal cleavage/methylation domain-containing protein